MRSLYQYASSVTVWLESAPEGIDQAFAVASKLEKGNIFIFPRDSPELPPLYQLLDRAWWKRTWMVQEFCAAQAITFECEIITISARKYNFPCVGQLLKFLIVA